MATHVAGQPDETLVEVLRFFAVAQGILHVPHEFVDRLQFGAQRFQLHIRFEHLQPQRHQAIQLDTNVRQLRRVGDALGLDLQDGQLVDQLTHGNGREDVTAGDAGRRCHRKGVLAA